ncbi:MAG: hypothetical protein FWF49_04440, partial [Oscillospiraceae bacterium]|nr:hypothetical protein [Oscillospiraceae bacterium]
MKKWFNGIGNWLWAFLLAVAVVVVYKTFDNFGAIWSFFARFAAILTPFIAGFVIAFLLYSPANALEKFLKKHRWGILTRGARGVSVLAVYLVLIAALTLLAVFGIPALATAVTNFVSGLL